MGPAAMEAGSLRCQTMWPVGEMIERRPTGAAVARTVEATMISGRRSALRSAMAGGVVIMPPGAMRQMRWSRLWRATVAGA